METLKELWLGLKEQWLKERREHPVLSNLMLFGIPAYAIIYTVFHAFATG